MLRELLERVRRPAMVGEMFSYDDQRRMIADTDPAVRRQVAASSSVRPEILYYLAKDASPEVRLAVAGNDATPPQADLLLAGDQDEEVRAELALKIARLVPDMPKDEREKVREVTLQTLETLARDQLPRVRAVLAEALRSSRQVPRAVILQLARDLHQIVHAPILEYSPMLSDADLLEVIAAGTATTALQSIARREGVSENVSDAVAATLDVPAIANLLANKSASVRSSTLDRIIENAEEVEAWHAPLTTRPELSTRAIRRIAGFVAASLVEVLARRNDLDEATASELSTLVQERLRQSNGSEAEAAEARARRLAAAGGLDEETIMGALEGGDRSFVMHSLAVLSSLPFDSIERILRTRNGKAVTALAWRAKLSMRGALRLQSQLAKVPPAAMLQARHGTDYPMTPEEMNWQLEAFA